MPWILAIVVYVTVGLFVCAYLLVTWRGRQSREDSFADSTGKWWHVPALILICTPEVSIPLSIGLWPLYLCVRIYHVLRDKRAPCQTK